MRLMPFSLALALCSAALSLPTAAQTIFPLNRAEILASSLFDFKVEFPAVVDPAQVKVTINGVLPVHTSPDEISKINRQSIPGTSFPHRRLVCEDFLQTTSRLLVRHFATAPCGGRLAG